MFVSHNPVRFVDPWGLYQVMIEYIHRAGRANFTFTTNNGNVSVTANGHTSSHEYQLIMGFVTVDSNWLVSEFGFSQDSVIHLAGDRFGAVETAALAFALIYNPRSFIRSERHPDGREHGANIYRQNRAYSFQQVRIGSGTRVRLAGTRRRYGTLVAQIHTHGAYMHAGSDNDFSSSDTRRAVVDQFLATPSGTLLRRNFISEGVRGTWCTGRADNRFTPTEVVATGLPHDTVDSWRNRPRR